jgi:N-dimethylarginine dimethylaminohydrolase
VIGELFFMSPPGRSWALRGRANFRSRDAEPVRPLAARKEWVRLARAIEDLGGTVVVLEPRDETLTGMPYAAEAGHILPPRTNSGEWRFLLPTMKAPHRQGERDEWATLARELGFEVIDPKGGIWEAQGDVAEMDGVTLLFFGGRTDRGGLDAARREFEGETLVLELREPAFHGNMAVLPLPAVGRLLVCPDVIVGDGVARLERRFEKSRILPVSEDEIRSYATNGLPVGDTWLAPSVVPERVKALVSEAGMRVVTLEMRELCEKAGGASRCLVCRASAPIQVPEAHRLAKVEREILGEPDDG